jgi:hypothetical protein
LFEEFSACEVHGATDIVEDVAGFDYLIRWSFAEELCHRREVPVMIKLVVDVLGMVQALVAHFVTPITLP